MINNKEEEKRRSKFKNVLKKLSEKAVDVKTRGELYTDINYIYTGNGREVDFRHYYSDVFSVLIEIKNNGGNLELISSNLKEMYEFSKKKNNYELADCVRKLLDHTNLEVARILYLSLLDNKRIRPDEIDKSLDKMGERVGKQEKRVEKLTKDTDNAYSNFIAILGIFSAVVMVFFGGSTVFSKAVGHIYDTALDRMVLVCTLCGMMIFDIIFMFIYFLSKLLDKPISAIEYPVYWEKIFVRFKLRYPIVFFTNLIGSLLLIGSVSIIVARKILNLKINDSTVYNLIRDYIHRIMLGHQLLSIIIVLGIVFNGLFVCAYIVAKIMDVNIGRCIMLSDKNIYWWDIDDGKYVVYRTGMVIKQFETDEANKMFEYINSKNKWYNIRASICNFGKRAFLRYPFFSIVNIVLLVGIVSNKIGR